MNARTHANGLLKTRLLVAAPGERLPDPWWRSQFLTLTGLRVGVRVFPRRLVAAAQAERMIGLARRTSGLQNVLFLIDEAGQYVAPRGELILNLDGLARNLKELGKGRVWIVATGQQTLAEIVEQAAYNSAELNKLRDRFPITIQLDARDIRQITYLRLLTKSEKAQKDLADRYDDQGPLITRQASGATPLSHPRTCDRR